MKEERLSRWYFGGLAGAGAVCVTHPLDLLKVNLQTYQRKVSILQVTRTVIKTDGVLGLYNGISASILRQLTYSLTRYGIYEILKPHFMEKGTHVLPFHISIALAAVGGACGGMVGNPADVINVRMGNDMKLPVAKRRNYNHALHGMYYIVKNEDVSTLWSGWQANICRSAVMTVGQLSVYDITKSSLLQGPYFKDDVFTHITSSVVAGVTATFLTQPMDVIKTRVMNAKPGEYHNTLHAIRSTMSEGPLAFYKGFIPALARLAPQTIIFFIFVEQLRINFGVIKVAPRPEVQ